jgi:mannosyl-glycoprotein endo-beta-N-acetylglucosaminidase
MFKILHASQIMVQRCGGNMRAAYRLSHWRCIDTFVYFSHHLVTLPPAGWVTAAHLHGTKVSMYALQDNTTIALSTVCAGLHEMPCR